MRMGCSPTKECTHPTLQDMIRPGCTILTLDVLGTRAALDSLLPPPCAGCKAGGRCAGAPACRAAELRSALGEDFVDRCRAVQVQGPGRGLTFLLGRGTGPTPVMAAPNGHGSQREALALQAAAGRVGAMAVEGVAPLCVVAGAGQQALDVRLRRDEAAQEPVAVRMFMRSSGRFCALRLLGGVGAPDGSAASAPTSPQLGMPLPAAVLPGSGSSASCQVAVCLRSDLPQAGLVVLECEARYACQQPAGGADPGPSSIPAVSAPEAASELLGVESLAVMGAWWPLVVLPGCGCDAAGVAAELAELGGAQGSGRGVAAAVAAAYAGHALPTRCAKPLELGRFRAAASGVQQRLAFLTWPPRPTSPLLDKCKKRPHSTHTPPPPPPPLRHGQVAAVRPGLAAGGERGGLGSGGRVLGPQHGAAWHCLQNRRGGPPASPVLGVRLGLHGAARPSLRAPPPPAPPGNAQPARPPPAGQGAQLPHNRGGGVGRPVRCSCGAVPPRCPRWRAGTEGRGVRGRCGRPFGLQLGQLQDRHVVGGRGRQRRRGRVCFRGAELQFGRPHLPGRAWRLSLRPSWAAFALAGAQRRQASWAAVARSEGWSAGWGKPRHGSALDPALLSPSLWGASQAEGIKAGKPPQ
jgi:hypothetical protein